MNESEEENKAEFSQPKRIASARNIVAVNGCCYGQESAEDKGDHLKKCGQSFWSFISGNEQLYTGIIEPLGHTAKERNEDFAVEYGKVITRFTAEFTQNFCQPDGTILWEKFVQFNSAFIGEVKEGTA